MKAVLDLLDSRWLTRVRLSPANIAFQAATSGALLATRHWAFGAFFAIGTLLDVLSAQFRYHSYHP